jgi:ferredoxin
VADFEERQVGGLRVRIDRNLCVGFGDCIEGAPEAFVLDDEGLAVFKQPDTVERARLVAACDACPVDAITVWDEAGAQLAPGEPGTS